MPPKYQAAKRTDLNPVSYNTGHLLSLALSEVQNIMTTNLAQTHIYSNNLVYFYMRFRVLMAVLLHIQFSYTLGEFSCLILPVLNPVSATSRILLPLEQLHVILQEGSLILTSTLHPQPITASSTNGTG